MKKTELDIFQKLFESKTLVPNKAKLKPSVSSFTRSLLLLALFFSTLLLQADEFDMFDTVDEIDSSKSAFQEDNSFLNKI